MPTLICKKKRKKKKRKMKNERVTASVSSLTCIIFYNTCLKTNVKNRYESKRVLFSLGRSIKYPWKFSWVPMESFGMGRSFSSDSVRGADFLNFSFRLWHLELCGQQAPPLLSGVLLEFVRYSKLSSPFRSHKRSVNKD